MEKRKQTFNHLKLKKLFDEALQSQSYRQASQKFNINRNSFTNWLGGKTKFGPNEESWDKIIHLFAEMNIFISKSDFYGDEIMPYNHEKRVENYLTERQSGVNPNLMNDQSVAELVEKLIKLEELYKERCRHILELREEKDKVIEEKDMLLQEKDDQIKILIQTIEDLHKKQDEKE